LQQLRNVRDAVDMHQHFDSLKVWLSCISIDIFEQHGRLNRHCPALVSAAMFPYGSR
jgi:hypothetical protein